MDATAPRPKRPRSNVMGRPKLPPDQVRGRQFSIMVSQPMYDWLEAECEYYRLTKAEYFDMLVRYHAGKTKNPRQLPLR